MIAGLGITVAFGIIGIFGKINIEITALKNKVATLEADYVSVNTLQSDVANIRTLITGAVFAKDIQTVPCPKGQVAGLWRNSESISIGCGPMESNAIYRENGQKIGIVISPVISAKKRAFSFKEIRFEGTPPDDLVSTKIQFGKYLLRIETLGQRAFVPPGVNIVEDVRGKII